MGQRVPKVLEGDYRLDVALVAQRRDHVAEYRQTRLRSFGDGKTIFVQFRGNLREPVPVGKPVAHEPVQGVGRVDDKTAFVSGRPADMPAARPEAIAEAVANLSGGDDARGV